MRYRVYTGYGQFVVDIDAALETIAVCLELEGAIRATETKTGMAMVFNPVNVVAVGAASSEVVPDSEGEPT